MEAGAGRELVRSLTNLVSCARNFLPSGNQSADKELDESLKTLYPSTNGCKAIPCSTSALSASTTNSVVTPTTVNC